MKDPRLVKILRWGIYAAAFMPLIIFNDFLSPFHFGKGIIFRSLVELLAVFYIVLVLRDRSFLPPRTPLFWSITAFTLAFGLTTFTSFNIFQSFWGSLERMGGWFSFIHFWLYFVIASAVLRDKESWLTLIKISVFIGLLSAFYGFLQKTSANWVIGSGGRVKIFGTLGNPALFAGYMIINAFLALMLASRPRITSNAKYFYVGIFLLNAVAISLAGVRGSVLALVTGLVIFGSLYAVKLGNHKIFKITLALVSLIVSLTIILALLKNEDFVKSNQYLTRYADISPTSYTVRTRTWAWRAGFDGLNDSVRAMLVGYGPENFNIPFSRHFNPNFFRGLGSETLFDRAHNQFLEILFTMGLVGFLAYLSVFFFAFKELKKNPRLTGQNSAEERETIIFKVALFSTLVAYIIHNSFIFDTPANYLLFFAVLGFINFLSLKPQQIAAPTIVSQKGGILPNLIGLILLVLASWLIFYANILPAKANYTTTRGIVASWAGQHDLAFEKFKKALEYNGFGRYEIRNRFAQYMLEWASKNKPNAKIEQRLLVAIENEKKNVVESPFDYLPYLYISRSYVILGKSDPKSLYNDLALENVNKALAISPTFVRTHYELAQVYLNKKDYAKAIKAFKKAAELNPNVPISWWYLGVTQIEAGDKASGIASLNQAFALGYDYKTSKEDLTRLLTIYLSLSDLEGTVRIYQRLIELEPQNPNYHAALAAVYGKLGKIDEAVAEAKLSVQIDRNFEAAARTFVRNLGREW